MSGPRPSETPTPPPPDWRKLHLWHIQPIRDILIILIVLGIIHVGYILRPITVPMLLALALAYLFEPLIKRFTRRGLVSRPGAVIGIIGAAFLFVVIPLSIGLGLASVQGLRLASGVASNTRSLIQSVQETDSKKQRDAFDAIPPAWQEVAKYLNPSLGSPLVPVEPAGPPTPTVPNPADQSAPGVKNTDKPDAPPPADSKPSVPSGTEPHPETTGHAAAARHVPGENVRKDTSAFIVMALDWINSNAESIAKNVGQGAISTGKGAVATAIAALQSVATTAFGVFLTAVFFFFFSTGWGKVLDFWSKLIPDRKKNRVFDLLDQMDHVIAGFVRGRLTICAILAVYMTITLWIIGVPVPLIVGPCVGLLYLVPFLHVVSIPVAIMLLWLQPSSISWQTHWWWIVFAPIVVDLSGQFIDDWILSPVIQGKVTNMDTPTILFASIAGGLIGGMYGLLVAIPVAACIRILVRELVWPRFQRWAKGQAPDPLPLAASPAPEPPVKKK